MADTGLLRQPEQVKAVADRHQALMWEVGDLLSQWEMLQTESAEQPRSRNRKSHYDFVIPPETAA